MPHPNFISAFLYARAGFKNLLAALELLVFGS